jgi:hypothetical protein
MARPPTQTYVVHLPKARPEGDFAVGGPEDVLEVAGRAAFGWPAENIKFEYRTVRGGEAGIVLLDN